MFCCQVPALNKWLKTKALRNHSTGISRVYAVCAENTNRIIGIIVYLRVASAIRQCLGHTDATHLMSFRSLSWDGLPSTTPAPVLILPGRSGFYENSDMYREEGCRKAGWTSFSTE